MLLVGSFPCVALLGCAASNPAPPLKSNDLLGTAWRVEDLAHRGVIDNALITIQFDASGNVSGSGSCNRYSARYTASGNDLKIGLVASTRRACAPALMHQENLFFQLLAQVNAYGWSHDGAFILQTSTGDTITARH